MPFFAVEKQPYPESNASAEHLISRFGAELIIAVLDTMLVWVQEDKQPGRQEVELVGTEDNQAMASDVRRHIGAFNFVESVTVTRAWVAARKAGYREMRDGKFSLFVDKVKAAAARRK